MNRNMTFSGVYYFSRVENNRNRAEIFNSLGNTIWEARNLKNGSFNLGIETKGINLLNHLIFRRIFSVFSF